MTPHCTTCRRPVPLSGEETAVLIAAADAAGGVRVGGLPASQAASVRALVRLGYLVIAANENGLRGKIALLTEHGRRWLAANGHA